MLLGNLVRLRLVERDDLPLLIAWANDQDVNSEYNFFGLHPTSHMEQDFNEHGMFEERQGQLIIETVAGDTAGTISYRQVTYGPNYGSRPYSIGIALHPNYRGKGYGVEAQRLLAEYLFQTYPISRVEAETDVTNIAEQRALEKAGFMREGVKRKAQWRGGEWHDLVLYGKLRDE